MTKHHPSDTPRAAKSVLITGCSSGIGRACVVEMAQRGWSVFAGVRNEQDGERLRALVGDTLQPVVLDITNQGAVFAAADSVGTHLDGRRLDGLVNNAGILLPGPLELVPSSQLREQLEVNVIGTHSVTSAMLPLMRQGETEGCSARLVLIGSISGRITPPFYGAYSASKHALEAMANAWRMELKPWAIAVSIVQPDSIATSLWNKATHGIGDLVDGVSAEFIEPYQERLEAVRRASLANSRAGLPVSKVVSAVCHALSAKRPKSRYPVGWRTRAAFLANRILPQRAMDYILSRVVR